MVRAALWRRTRPFGTALGAGAVAGFVGALVAPLVGVDTNSVFAFGALLLGFGTLGWTGSVMMGEAIEEAGRLLDTGAGWSEADSRRAMARVAVVGAGIMVGVVPATVV